MMSSLLEQAKIAETQIQNLDEAQDRLLAMIDAQREGQAPVYADLIAIIATIQEAAPDCMGCLLKPTLHAVHRSRKRLSRFISNTNLIAYGNRKYSDKETD